MRSTGKPGILLPESHGVRWPNISGLHTRTSDPVISDCIEGLITGKEIRLKAPRGDQWVLELTLSTGCRIIGSYRVEGRKVSQDYWDKFSRVRIWWRSNCFW